jgi:hypothetical protein
MANPMADITRFVATPESVRDLHQLQINKFFARTPGLTLEGCVELAAGILECRSDVMLPTESQGAQSFTLIRANSPPGRAAAVVQFRDLDSPLNVDTIQLAHQTYGDIVPSFQVVHCGLDDVAHVYTMPGVAGSVFMMAKHDFYRDMYDERLTRSVSDFAMFVLLPFRFPKANRKQLSRFIASSLSSARYNGAGQTTAQVYNAAQKLNALESTLPARFDRKFAEMRKWLPIIFGPEYPQVLNHADLVEPNIHVDESSGAIPGIVDWEGAEFGPFGTALGALEFFLGVQTGDSGWLWHPQHHHLHAVFYQVLCESLTKYQLGMLGRSDRCSAPFPVEWPQYGHRYGLPFILVGCYLPSRYRTQITSPAQSTRQHRLSRKLEPYIGINHVNVHLNVVHDDQNPPTTHLSLHTFNGAMFIVAFVFVSASVSTALLNLFTNLSLLLPVLFLRSVHLQRHHRPLHQRQ